jgi:hypothetical protein
MVCVCCVRAKPEDRQPNVGVWTNTQNWRLRHATYCITNPHCGSPVFLKWTLSNLRRARDPRYSNYKTREVLFVRH